MNYHRCIPIFVVLLLLLPLSGCGKLAYYGHTIKGQMQVWQQRRDISDVLADPATPPALKQKLQAVLDIRAYASRELGLPDNRSYQSYADLKRKYVVWNVFAAPELSVTPEQWCFMFAGCVSYRGYFSEDKAKIFAGDLKQQGYDVYIGGVSAYSTLGWFNDPMLNTVIHRPMPNLAGLIFHELAHAVVYVKGDTTFNESFATTVELEGTRRWLQQQNDDNYSNYVQQKQRHQEFVQLILNYRERLQQLYQSEITDNQKRQVKKRIIAELKQAYSELKIGWHGDARYDGWFTKDINNAQLSSVGTYHSLVPAFQALLTECQGDLPTFYERVKQLGELTSNQRQQTMQALLNRHRVVSKDS